MREWREEGAAATLRVGSVAHSCLSCGMMRPIRRQQVGAGGAAESQNNMRIGLCDQNVFIIKHVVMKEL